MLLVAYTPFIKLSDEINLVCQFGFGNNVKHYSIYNIAKSVGNENESSTIFSRVCGCDTVSSFFNHSKARFWDSWIKNVHEGQLTEVF